MDLIVNLTGSQSQTVDFKKLIEKKISEQLMSKDQLKYFKE